MPDAKITALTAISVIDVAADVLPIVDISDTSMAASGTTKKITINQILGASGTATFSVLTVSGAATAQRFIPSSATVPTNGMYLPAANELGWAINSAEVMRLNSTGLGVGVALSAWSGISSKVFEFGNSGSNNSLWGNGTNDLHLVSNAYFNGTNWIYNRNAFATRYNQLNGSHVWHNAPSGTAGNAITFTQAMTLDASGRLLVGPTSAFTDLTGSKEVRIGDSGMQTLTVASLPAATATNIARGGVGGLVYVGGFNGTGQYGAVVLWTAASATVVSVINGTGSTITFGVSGGFLQITSSLVLTQVTASCIRI